MKVFLGGTCAGGTKWRDDLIKMLKIDYFNPVVDDWAPECMEKELEEREKCDYCLYVITPKMTGVYSIAEVVDDSNKRPGKTIFAIIGEPEIAFDQGQIKSLHQVELMVEANGAEVFYSISGIARYLNSKA